MKNYHQYYSCSFFLLESKLLMKAQIPSKLQYLSSQPSFVAFFSALQLHVLHSAQSKTSVFGFSSLKILDVYIKS